MTALKIVFILSTNYSGSHLLAQLLGAHSQCLSIGELHNFRKLKDRRRAGRNVVNDYQSNPLFHGLAERSAEQWHQRILTNAAQHRPATRVLIDNSKRPQWAAKICAAQPIDARYIHLVRDPRALVRRWCETYVTRAARRAQRRRLARQRPSAIPTCAFGPIESVYAMKWVAANEAISDYLAGRKAPVISYDALATDPVSILARLMPSIGLSFEPSQLDYGRAAHSGTLKRDYLRASGHSQIEADRRWQTELPTAIADRVTEMRAVRRYVAQLGMRLDADGLWELQTPLAQNASSRSSVG
ncbi:MAG: sulfotransferase [Gammaproteobacteria bacterium]|nr:sulfotransferase [Gammaproteobacteria bacterium]